MSEDTYLGSGKNLKRALKKYGKENFSKEILEICISEEDAYNKEIYYISKKNAVQSDKFYNLASGGQGGFETTFAGKTEEDLNLWRQRMSESRKGRVMSPEWISKIIATRKERGIGVGVNNPMYGKASPKALKVVMISLDGKHIKTFNSTLAALKFVKNEKNNSSLIDRVCRDKSGTAYGYFWLFEEDYMKMIENNTYTKWLNKSIKRYVNKIRKVNRSKVQKNSKKVYQLDRETFEIIALFDSVAIASDLTKIRSTSISRVCNHGCNTAGGYCWCYKDEFDKKSIEEIKSMYTRKVINSEKYRNRPQTKIPIYCITTKQKFDSACDAIDFFGLCKGANIQAVCKGKRKSAGKHPQTGEPLVWMYYKDYVKKVS